MYIKVANGEAYDILVPSDYMIQRLISEGYLQKLDKSKLNCISAGSGWRKAYKSDSEYGKRSDRNDL